MTDSPFKHYFQVPEGTDFRSTVREIDRRKRIEGDNRECVQWRTTGDRDRRESK